MMRPPEIFQEIYAKHGHRCPMSTLGGRMGLAVIKVLGADPATGLTVVFEHDTCAVDGIELTTGCSRDAGSLSVEAAGRHALVARLNDGRGVRVSLNANALATAWEYRTADEAFTAGKGVLGAAELQTLFDQKEAILQSVLERLWTWPDEQLLTVERF